MEQTSFKLLALDKEFPAWYVKDDATALQILSELEAKDVLFAVDTETEAFARYHAYPKAALSPHLSGIRLLQVSDGKNVIVFDFKFLSCKESFIPFLSTKRFIAHNAIFDYQFFLKLGVKEMNLGCTRILAKLIFHAFYPTDAGHDADLKSLCKALLGVDISKAQQSSDWSMPELTFEQVQYAALDVVYTLAIAEKLAPGLEKYGLVNSYKLFKASQLPLAKMQFNGFKLDVVAHRALMEAWKEEMLIMHKRLLEYTGLENITNHTMGRWLEENLEGNDALLWPRTPTGKFATNAAAFFENEHIKVIEPLAQYQKLCTVLQTFGSKFKDKINPESGRLHSNFNICGARTGRLSSNNPNLQNAPRDDRFRKCFRAEPGNILIRADYNQIELRVAAELSQDPEMLSVYRNEQDIYRVGAAKIARKAIEDVTPLERQANKALSLGLLFGLGAEKFTAYARRPPYKVEFSLAEAEWAIEEWRELYSIYREWQLKQARLAETSKKCRTPLGKLRRLPDDNTFGNSMNHPIQGGAAEVMLSALIRLEKTFRGTEVALINTVHDEIIFECPNKLKLIHATIELINRDMTSGYLDIFPKGIVNKKLVNINFGETWLDAK